ncbi:MAG TPA: hypothetical protein VNN80_12110 [Polyangiaceae bacterium]|nr:hypothetical protein [Polyangiaceae bacterium]HWP04459.1 hypothetical protein [Polyangiaceae bacterium]
MAVVQIQESQLARLGEQVNRSNALASRLREQLKSKATQDNAVVLATAGAGAAGFGYLRGRMEAPSGAWNVPGTTIDVEAVAVVALTALALGGGMLHKSLKKLEEPATHVAAGVLGHYAGQLARKFAKTGAFSLVAGSYGMQPSPGAGDRSISFRQTQLSAPFSDPISEALSQSGV